MSQLSNFPPSLLIFLFLMTITILFVDLFFPKLKSTHSNLSPIYTLSLITVLLGFLWGIKLNPSTSIVFYSGHFIWDPLAAFLSIIILSASAFVLTYAESDLIQRSIAINDYYILALFSILGMLVLVSAGSMPTVYLGLEITSIPLYAMVALERQAPLRTEAAIKYIVMGAFASVLLLYAFVLLYSTHHSLILNNLYQTNIKPTAALSMQVGSILLLIAFTLKLGAVPFHFWVPDVYQGASTPVSLLIATLPKLAILSIGLRFTLGSSHLLLVSGWKPVSLGFGVLSIALGNLMALLQTNIKRLLAYSSIAHMGFILLALALSQLGCVMALFYSISYSLTILLIFGILTELNRLGHPVESLDNLVGLSQSYPQLAFYMLIAMLSMAGLPPFLGFFNKLGVLHCLLTDGLYGIACIIVIATIIGTYYYFTVVKLMYFESTSKSSLPISTQIHFSFFMLSINVIVLLGVGVYPDLLIHACEKVIETMSSLSMTH